LKSEPEASIWTRFAYSTPLLGATAPFVVPMENAAKTDPDLFHQFPGNKKMLRAKGHFFIKVLFIPKFILPGEISW
jgi:hypothetical protein